MTILFHHFQGPRPQDHLIINQVHPHQDHHHLCQLMTMLYHLQVRRQSVILYNHVFHQVLFQKNLCHLKISCN
jgi:hypothetical protein